VIGRPPDSLEVTIQKRTSYSVDSGGLGAPLRDSGVSFLQRFSFLIALGFLKYIFLELASFCWHLLVLIDPRLLCVHYNEFPHWGLIHFSNPKLTADLLSSSQHTSVILLFSPEGEIEGPVPWHPGAVHFLCLGFVVQVDETLDVLHLGCAEREQKTSHGQQDLNDTFLGGQGGQRPLGHDF